jgi:hypothetical protein
MTDTTHNQPGRRSGRLERGWPQRTFRGSVVAVLAVAALGVAAPVKAAPAAAASSVTAAVMSGAGPAANISNCLYGLAIYNTNLNVPEKKDFVGPVAPGRVRANVEAYGKVTIRNNTNCSNPSARFILETKVCGSFGCNWEGRAQSQAIDLPTNGSRDAIVNMICRKGSNSYRLRANIVYTMLDFEQTPLGNWIPYLITETRSHYSNTVKITCTAA